MAPMVEAMTEVAISLERFAAAFIKAFEVMTEGMTRTEVCVMFGQPHVTYSTNSGKQVTLLLGRER